MEGKKSAWIDGDLHEKIRQECRGQVRKSIGDRINELIRKGFKSELLQRGNEPTQVGIKHG